MQFVRTRLARRIVIVRSTNVTFRPIPVRSAYALTRDIITLAIWWTCCISFADYEKNNRKLFRINFEFRIRTSSFAFRASSFEFQVSSFEFRFPNCEFKLRISNFGFIVSDFEFQKIGNYFIFIPPPRPVHTFMTMTAIIILCTVAAIGSTPLYITFATSSRCVAYSIRWTWVIRLTIYK